MTDELAASIGSVKYGQTVSLMGDTTVWGETLRESLIPTAGDTFIAEDGKAIRIGGADRYATSQMIVDQLFHPVPNPAMQGLVATGTNFPDALAGSAYAGASNSALWVVKPTCIPSGVFVTAAKIGIKGSKYIGLLGGEGALSKDVADFKVCN
jgi:hypothetical protein